MQANQTTSNATFATTTDRGVTAARASRRMAAIAVAAAGLALLAGLSFLVVDPSAGSRLEAVPGVTAAASGIASGVLIAAAAINAQLFGGWAHLPTWVRRAAMVVLLVVVVVNLVRPFV